MKNMINFISLFAVSAAFSTFADPTVQSVIMAQADDRTVTITYTLSEAPAVVTLDIETNGVSIGGANIQYVAGDVNKKVSDKATYTITWRPDVSWQGNLADAQAVVTAWPLDNTPDYMVVDLTAPKTDNVRYYTSTNFFPGGLLSNRKYRTTSVVMRKILAKGVTWNMGCGVDDVSRVGDNTENLHAVMLTNNYYIGVFEVTQAQWALVQPNRSALSTDFSLEEYKTMRPIAGVCYNEIRMADNSTTAHADAEEWPGAPYSGSFLGRLRSKTDIDFDLPSDAEWEYACRAEHGDSEWNNGVSYTSSTIASTVPGRYTGNGGNQTTVNTISYASCTDANGTAVCGSYAPSSWGLYDMHGNVGEWCLDWYKADLTGTDGSVVTEKQTNRVRRSGLGSDNIMRLRSAARVGNKPNLQHQYIGFRLACRVGLK